MEPNPTSVARVVSQPIVAPLSRAAIFLVVTLNPKTMLAPRCGRSAET